VRWFQIPLPRIEQPSTGSYNSWKALLAEEGRYQCVYCAISEAAWGGYRNFHVEHYRPKKPFDGLVNIIGNLYYACSVCNSFKGNDWPGDPIADLSTPCYPAPCDVDYNTQFTVDKRGIVSGATVASRYVLTRLHLNRVQLVLERREADLRERIEVARQGLELLVQQVGDGTGAAPRSLLVEAVAALSETVRVQNLKEHIRPYLPEQLERERTLPQESARARRPRKDR
jgi:hypothetical protein